MRICIGILLTMALAAGGCVERTITVSSNPQGALVYLNDQEVGRTPFTRDFTWYGVYEVAVRKEGYTSIKTSASILPPVYEWVPLDLVSELAPIKFKDHHVLTYDLKPDPPIPGLASELVQRAEAMKADLQSSSYTITHPATTRPAKKPAATTKPSAATTRP